MHMKTILLAAVAVVVALVVLRVYRANRLLRVDFWTHRPGATVLPPPTGAYADFLGPYVHDPQTDLGLSYESVEFKAKDGEPLRGWLVPRDARSTTAIVTVHGLGAD